MSEAQTAFGATTATGYVTLLLGVGEQHYGIPRARLLQAASLTEPELDDPSGLLSERALWDLMRFIRAESGDEALGLRLVAAFDLRTQGFWGYALLSSTSVRERMERHARYSQLRTSISFSLRVDGQHAMVDFDLSPVPRDLVALICDWGIGTACVQHRRRLQRVESGLQLWVSYPEQPHHRELRELVGGAIVFDAPCTRMQFPASDLAQQLEGDPHLGRLAVVQLERQLLMLRERRPSAGQELLDEVRTRLGARLGGDASLERIAQDLHVSARTLRRRLGALDSSYQALLAEVRLRRALAWLTETDLAVEQIAEQLGYGDPANFRRAFRRWKGLTPSGFRAAERAHGGQPPAFPPASPPAMRANQSTSSVVPALPV
jgi:AraC-like DNA-binding protein